MTIQQMMLGVGGVSYYDAELYAWGLNDFGQAGNNTSGPGLYSYSSPVQIPGTLWGAVGRSENSYHVAATQQDGTLWQWGRNQNGRLGQNNNTDYSSPVQVPGTWAVGYNKCIANHRSTHAIRKDGSLWGWGGGNQGILGLNDTTQYSSPKQVGSGTDWQAVTSNGSAQTVAVKTDGTMWSWGTMENGGLGLNQGPGTASAFSSPIQVGSGTNWSSNISGGRNHFAAIKTDGTLWTWGSNGGGALGLGESFSPSKRNRSSPTQVGSDTSWSKIAAGYAMCVATKTDGTLWSWGGNEDGTGTLGHNNFNTSYSSPKQIPGTNWNYDGGDNAADNSYPVFASMTNAGAIRSGGTLWMWGRNRYGENAQNNNFPGYYAGYSSPVQVPGTGWYAIMGGETNFLALKDVTS